MGLKMNRTDYFKFKLFKNNVHVGFLEWSFRNAGYYGVGEIFHDGEIDFDEARQLTGFLDIEKREIYIGDILVYADMHTAAGYKVEMEKGFLCARSKNGGIAFALEFHLMRIVGAEYE